MTIQFLQLQDMQDKYGEENFAVLGFPTDQFGSFAAGTDQEVKDFCQAKYKVSFDLFSKIEVNGEQAAPFYGYLTSQDAPPTGKGDEIQHDVTDDDVHGVCNDWLQYCVDPFANSGFVVEDELVANSPYVQKRTEKD